MENALTLIVIVLLFVIIIMLFVIIIVWMKSRHDQHDPHRSDDSTKKDDSTKTNKSSGIELQQITRENLPVALPEDPSITDEQALAILSYSINDIEESRKKGWE